MVNIAAAIGATGSKDGSHYYHIYGVKLYINEDRLIVQIIDD